MAFAKWYRKRKVRGKRDHGGGFNCKIRRQFGRLLGDNEFIVGSQLEKGGDTFATSIKTENLFSLKCY